ncbi:MAG: carboxylesterase family protein [Planctomycetota bacterium]|jgi:predicted esterase
MMIDRLVFSGLVCLVSLGSLETALAEESDLESAVAVFFAAERGGAKEKAAEAIKTCSPSAAELEALLKAGRGYRKALSTGWSVRKNRARDGKERPYHLLVPGNYDPSKKYALLVNMHGGVSRPALIPDEYFAQYRDQMWADDSREGEYILVMPLGQKGAEWWNPTGLDNILGIVSKVKKSYNIDENKIFTTGFSDGGSGSFFLAVSCTTPFAGFIPLNGFPPVAGAGGVPVYLPNASNKPMHVVNTTADQLYPAKNVTPFIEAMKDAGARIAYKVYENIGHRPDYWPRERERCIAFIRDNARDPLPKSLTWETSSREFGRCHWVWIDEVEKMPGAAEELVKDYNPLLTIDRVRVGFFPDQEFSGTGVRVDRLADGENLAKTMGLEAGDIIVEMDGKPVGGLSDLREILGGKKPGDSLSLEIRRGDDKIEMKGNFADPKPAPAFNRTQVAGRVHVKCTGNLIEILSRNVARCTLYVSRDMIDVDKAVKVKNGGTVLFEGFVTPDVNCMLEMAARDDDRTAVFWGKIELDLRPREGKEEDDSEF